MVTRVHTDDRATPTTPVRIVLADDHEVVRSGLRMLLEAEDAFEVVAEAGDMEAARRYVRAHRPQVLVLDINMPEGSSLPAIPALRDDSPDTAVVVLTMQADPAFAREAMRAGALGYVIKHSAANELVQAVNAAAAGETYLNPKIGAQLAAAPPEHEGAPDGLSGARAGDPASDCSRPHQFGGCGPALPECPHGRVPPSAHPAEDRAFQSR